MRPITASSLYSRRLLRKVGRPLAILAALDSGDVSGMQWHPKRSLADPEPSKGCRRLWAYLLDQKLSVIQAKITELRKLERHLREAKERCEPGVGHGMRRELPGH